MLLEPSLQTIALSYVLQELQGIEYMPASFFIPLVNILRRYFFVVLQELYTNLTFYGTNRFILRVFSYFIFFFIIRLFGGKKKLFLQNFLKARQSHYESV